MKQFYCEIHRLDFTAFRASHCRSDWLLNFLCCKQTLFVLCSWAGKIFMPFVIYTKTVQVILFFAAPFLLPLLHKHWLFVLSLLLISVLVSTKLNYLFQKVYLLYSSLYLFCVQTFCLVHVQTVFYKHVSACFQLKLVLFG